MTQLAPHPPGCDACDRLVGLGRLTRAIELVECERCDVRYAANNGLAHHCLPQVVASEQEESIRATAEEAAPDGGREDRKREDVAAGVEL